LNDFEPREKQRTGSQWHQNGITTANGHIVATRNAPRRTTSHHVAPRRTLCLSARAWPLLLAEDQSDEKMKKKKTQKKKT
jgi:hypothetical protein